MDSLHATYDAARRALDAGDFDQAVALLDRMLQQFPQFVDAHQLFGEAYVQARRYHDAIASFRHVLDADPEHVHALYGLGAAYYYLGNAADAQAAWERVLEIQPNLAELRVLMRQAFPSLCAQATEQITQAGLARLYARSDMLDRAIEVLQVEVGAQLERIDLGVALVETFWRAKRITDTRRMCYELLALNPQLMKPTLLLAYILMKDHQPGGTALWQRAAAQDPLQTIARSLFATLPSVPAPAPHPVPVEAGTVHVNAQQGTPSDDEALLLQLLSDVPPSVDVVAQAPEQASSTLTMDELVMANGIPEQANTNDLLADELSDNADPTAAAAINSPSNHVPVAAFDAIFAQADAAPAKHVLRLAVARLGWHLDPQRSLGIYKQLVKDGALLDDVVDDLLEQIDSTADSWVQHSIYRVLGDAYMRQHCVAEATQAYGRAFPEHAAPQQG